MREQGWQRTFEDPIDLPGGRQLGVAAEYAGSSG
jgi:hypothetical protein